MSDPTHLSLAEARDALKSKQLSAVELAQAHIDAISKSRALNCFITETPEFALAQAQESDARIARG
ncbi:MAG: Asp-tRNA(Asn)/Glu-tRNA(Gln) amidotransferase subunit GatA, partial [Rhodoplanes sp.]